MAYILKHEVTEIDVSVQQQNYSSELIPEIIEPNVIFWCAKDKEMHDTGVDVYEFSLNLQFTIKDNEGNEIAKYRSMRSSQYLNEPYEKSLIELFGYLEQNIFPTFKDAMKIAYPHGNIIHSRLVLPSKENFQQAVSQKLSHIDL